jgi:2-aminoadipate transaminase
MKIDLVRNSKTPLFIQIKNHIRSKIIAGKFPEGYKLPSERVFAEQLKVHRNTIVKAYKALVDESFVSVSQNPRGYFVSNQSEPSTEPLQQSGSLSNFDYIVRDEFMDMNSLFSKLFVDSLKGDVISFAADILSECEYPVKSLNEILTDLISEGKYDLYGYCDPQGLKLLRKNISDMLKLRDINASPGCIQIVSETYQALDYIIKLFVSPGDTIIAEEPIISDTYNFFKLMGVNVVTVPVDGDGMVVDYIEPLILKYKPKFIYTIPTFHYPSTTVMSLERRYKLLEHSCKYNIPIVEEDCDWFLNFEEEVPPSLKALDKHNNVIYLDSFIFSGFPGARIAYAVAPKKIVNKLSRLLEMNQIFVNSIGQYLISEFIERGQLFTHTENLRNYYREKRDLMCTALEEIGKLGLEYEIPKGGTCVWCKLPPGISQARLLIRAVKKGVIFYPGFLFYPFGNQGEAYIRISYGSSGDDEIVRGVGMLGDAILECMEND